MKKSKQSITATDAKGDVRQRSDANDATQSIADVRADSIEQTVQLSRIDLKALARELATLHAAMREEGSTGEHDLAVGRVAAAERAAAQGDAAGTFKNLKSAGKWALQTSEKIGVGVAIAAIKHALGL